jgi:acyl-CoA synthetase (AMP-forming)/AMP-acid ligase II
VAPGDRVAFIGASGPEFAEVLYGAAKAGAIFTAVNNRLAPPEVAAILADAEAELIGWTRDRLAHYKCPVGVSFAPALARTASGKQQKQAIRSGLGCG